jgi:hypothetical protein
MTKPNQTKLKTKMKITRIIKRHHIGCFTVEDQSGNHFLVQLDLGLEEMWKKAIAKAKA